MTEVPNRLLDRPDVAAPEAGVPDVLSDVLRTIRLSGSMLFLVEAGTPWKTQAPAARAFTRHVMPTAQHLISLGVGFSY